MNKNLGLPAGMLALFAVVFHLARPSGGEKPVAAHPVQSSSPMAPKTEAQKQAAKPARGLEPPRENPMEGPWLATRAFFHLDPLAGVVPRAPGRKKEEVDLSDPKELIPCAKDGACSKALRIHFGLRDAYTYEFLVATIPDPLHTRQALFTDVFIESIQKASEDAGWEFATQWLPWYDNVNPDERDPDRRRAQRAKIREQERQPGLLVFRHRTDVTKKPTDGTNTKFDHTLLLVWVVGETATAGVNGYEFQTARAYIEAFQSPNDSSEREKHSVRIMGPTFSGSFMSLGTLIDEDHAWYSYCRYFVRTGSAANNENAQVFRSSTEGVDFKSANASKADQRNRFCEVVQYLRIPPSQAAFVIEDESAYGHGFIVPEQSENKCKDSSVFFFPREISHLRNAYRDALEASRGDQPAPDVSFSLKDPDSGEDSVPFFSKTQTPLSQNAVLAEMVNEIRRKRIRIVDVGAVNILDLLFVARVLRRQVPDTRLVIGFPDLLFVQAENSEPLTGALALSAYPLFFQRKAWSHPGISATHPGRMHSGPTHSGATGAGVYNATLLLLARPENDPAAPPDSTIMEHLSDYGWRDQNTPPTWLMTLDHAGFMPVKVMSSTSEPRPPWNEQGPPSITHLGLPPPPRIWTLLIGLLAVFNLVFASWIVHLHRDPCERVLYRYAVVSSYPLDSPRVFCIFLSLLALSAMLAILWLPLVLSAKEEPRWFTQLLASAGFAVPAGVALWIVIARLWPRSPALKRPKSLFKIPRDHFPRRLGVLLALAAFAGALLIWAICCCHSPDQSFFFSFRALELRAGSSPAIPVLAAFLALFLFSIAHISRFYFAAEQRPRVYTAGFDKAMKGRLRKAQLDFHRWLLFPLNFKWKKQLFWCVATVLLTGGLWWFCRGSVALSSIDGYPYDFLVMGLQITVGLTLIATCLHLRLMWLTFHSFLAILNSLPVAAGFSRLRFAASGGPIWVRRINLQSLDIPARSAGVLQNMSLLQSSQLYAVRLTEYYVAKSLKIYESALEELLNERSKVTLRRKTRAEVRKDFRLLRHRSARAADEYCSLVVTPQSHSRPVPSQLAEEGPPSENSQEINPEAKDAYYLARAFVALNLSMLLMYGVRQIQNLLWFLSAGFVLLVISLSSYGLQSPQLISRCLIAIFLMLGYVIWNCMSQMERDPILSRIAGSNAGELNRDFYFRVIAYGALPVLGILASQFPAVSSFLFSWVQPTLEAIH